ncbi:hypothetical protein EWM64_g1214 [Hericium alpestre]|uniref:Uncharacterized protein n=1 Tax=Hericium alpestre TaxID=135208 RepID=A0A4Z0A942_9AGAM|nr:hypothetical protein EWM64_g1214 [Hericium alpestre]
MRIPGAASSVLAMDHFHKVTLPKFLQHKPAKPVIRHANPNLPENPKPKPPNPKLVIRHANPNLPETYPSPTDGQHSWEFSSASRTMLKPARSMSLLNPRPAPRPRDVPPPMPPMPPKSSRKGKEVQTDSRSRPHGQKEDSRAAMLGGRDSDNLNFAQMRSGSRAANTERGRTPFLQRAVKSDLGHGGVRDDPERLLAAHVFRDHSSERPLEKSISRTPPPSRPTSPNAPRALSPRSRAARSRTPLPPLARPPYTNGPVPPVPPVPTLPHKRSQSDIGPLTSRSTPYLPLRHKPSFSLGDFPEPPTFIPKVHLVENPLHRQSIHPVLGIVANMGATGKAEVRRAEKVHRGERRRAGERIPHDVPPAVPHDVPRPIPCDVPQDVHEPDEFGALARGREHERHATTTRGTERERRRMPSGPRAPPKGISTARRAQ